MEHKGDYEKQNSFGYIPQDYLGQSMNILADLRIYTHSCIMFYYFGFNIDLLPMN